MRRFWRWACLGLAACAGGNSAYSCSGYDEQFPLEPGTLRVSVPNGGEAWTGGDTVELEWQTGDPVDTVDIEVRRGGTVVATLPAVTNSGIVAWQVPIDLDTGEDYTVHVAVPGEEPISDDSDAPFAIRNWRMRRELMVTLGSDGASGRTLIDLPASDPILSGAGADGDELRFASNAERSMGFDLGYWIEQWDPNGARVWVELPPASGSVFVFWDSPGAEPFSNIEDVMPNRWESTGSGPISEPDLSVDAFIVHEGHTVKLTPGTPLVVEASLIIISGTIDASGSGYSGEGGPGLGWGSIEAAGGGGAYGGFGGTGGAFYPDDAGDGGEPYGDSADAVVEMGSGGGSADYVGGSSGGGRIELHGTHVRVPGFIFADGMNGPGGGGSCGAGGGAGGGIVLSGRTLTLTGTLSASGGFGGSGFPTDEHHGGGGGGGGRIKLIYTDALDDRGTTRASGGVGGDGYNTGEPGAQGSIHSALVTQPMTTISSGEETTLY